MLTTPAAEPPEPGFGYEFKWDGMRVLVAVGKGVEAISRNGNDALARFPELLGLPAALGQRCVLDGELVVLDGQGRPDFGLMQTRMAQSDPREIERSTRTHPVQFLAFDLLSLGGRDAMRKPYVERRALLEGLGLSGPAWAVPPYQAGPAAVVQEASRTLGLEGIVAKRLDSPYLPGQRTPFWQKVRNRNRQEFVVGGWTEGEGARAGTVGSLLLGVYGSPLGDDRLFYVGRSGSGFTEKTLRVLDRELRALRRKETSFHPFEDEGDTPPTFVKPRLVVEVEFSGLAHRKVLRQAAFKGLRRDKDAGEVVWEQPDLPPPWESRGQGDGADAGADASA
jgi:bifunctional non-homologous end joining protein LigD